MCLNNKSERLGLLIFGKRERFQCFWQGGFMADRTPNFIEDCIAPLHLSILRLQKGQELLGYYRMFIGKDLLHILVHYQYAEDDYGNAQVGRPSFLAFAIIILENQYPQPEVIKSLYHRLKNELTYRDTSYKIPYNIAPDIENSLIELDKCVSAGASNNSFFNTFNHLDKRISYFFTDKKLGDVVSLFFRKCIVASSMDSPFAANHIYLSNEVYNDLKTSQATAMDIWVGEFDDYEPDEELYLSEAEQKITPNKNIRKEIEDLIVEDSILFIDDYKKQNKSKAIIHNKEEKETDRQDRNNQHEVRQKKPDHFSGNMWERLLKSIVLKRIFQFIGLLVVLAMIIGLHNFLAKSQKDNPDNTSTSAENDQTSASHIIQIPDSLSSPDQPSLKSATLLELIKDYKNLMDEINIDADINLGRKPEEAKRITAKATERYIELVKEILEHPFNKLTYELGIKRLSQNNPTPRELMDEYCSTVANRLELYDINPSFLQEDERLNNLHAQRDHLFELAKKIEDNKLMVKSYMWIHENIYKRFDRQFFVQYQNNQKYPLSQAQKSYLNEASAEFYQIHKEVEAWFNHSKKTWIGWLEEAKDKNKVAPVLERIKLDQQENIYKSELLNLLRRDIYCIVINPTRRKQYLDNTLKNKLLTNYEYLRTEYVNPLSSFLKCYQQSPAEDARQCFNEELLNRGRPTIQYYMILKNGYTKTIYDDFSKEYNYHE
ncbi:hypothetical protein QQ020_21665 [Fulvivirgaceae bacterium BMA12]|uniref:Uncharacterized protein n=1 Tax=Agaribacillus aureus TaxID=3051825 RepID=A0ABT8LED9_9BACT|nr:hypothetical protein [Fulvivirgaceae bacterium BMA12]